MHLQGDPSSDVVIGQLKPIGVVLGEYNAKALGLNDAGQDFGWLIVNRDEPASGSIKS